MKKILIAFLAILTSGFLSLATFANNKTAKADDNNTPVVTLGTSLTSSQKQGTINTLTQSLNGANYTTITITGSDLVKYLNPSGYDFTNNSGVWSSAMVQKTNSGSGINVHILPYNGHNNITTITANQYKNAALTAGISDADIYGTSATPIDGNSLNQSQINAAQTEMNTLSKITNQNKSKEGYSDAQLNNAIAGAKKEMAKQGQNISNSQIRDIVNNQININHLGDTINNDQKEQIINVLIKVKNSGALKDKNFQQQAGQLTDQIQSGAKNIFSKFNTPETRNWFQKLIDSIVNWFRNIFGGAIILK